MTDRVPTAPAGVPPPDPLAALAPRELVALYEAAASTTASAADRARLARELARRGLHY